METRILKRRFEAHEEKKKNNEVLKSIIRERVATERKKQQLSQWEFSKKYGIPVSSLSSIEQGKMIPSCVRILKLAQCLNVTVDYLMGRTSIPF